MSFRLFTSESVTEGHPDKVCDLISDAVLDEALRRDPYARVACECLAKDGRLVIAGEITAAAEIDFAKIARDTVRQIGYTDNSELFSADNIEIETVVSRQSPDIALGVDRSYESRRDDLQAENGAGDQGLMFGYACRETEELMPAPIMYAHKLARRLTAVRKEGLLPYLRPDGKTQVTFRYEDGAPAGIDTVVVSTQHSADADLGQLRRDITDLVIRDVIPEELLTRDTKYYINPTGRFVIGGPEGDCGLTGRKIIVDTYGGYAPHGGGCFSGKDPTKVDRSGAYMMRYVAKNIVASGIADKCEIQVSYAIGVAAPVSVSVNTFGTGKAADERITECVQDLFDLRPGAIIAQLDLRRPIYRDLAAYGHMGREDLGVPFERTDRAAQIKRWFDTH